MDIENQMGKYCYNFFRINFFLFFCLILTACHKEKSAPPVIPPVDVYVEEIEPKTLPAVLR